MQSKAKSFHYYIRLIMWLTAIVPILFYSVYLVRLEVGHYAQKVDMMSTQTISELEIFLKNFDDEIRNSLNMFTSNYALQMVDENDQYAPLVNASIVQFNQGRAYKDIAFGLADGRMFTENIDILPAGYDPRTRPWYQIAEKNPGDIVVTDLYKDALDETKWTITYSKAVLSEKDKSIIGVAGADITLIKLEDVFEQYHVGGLYRMVLLDDTNRIIASTTEDGQLKMSDGSQWRESTTERQTISFDGKDYYSEPKSIQFMGWKVLLLTRRSTVYANVFKALLPVFVVAFLFALLVNEVIKRIDPIVLESLDQVVESIKQIGEGDYNSESQLTERAPREFVLINDEIESMKSLLGNQNSQLLRQKNEINEQYQEINALYEETSAMNESLTDLLTQVELSYGLTVEALSNAIEANDIYTRGHCDRVKKYSLMLGEAAGLTGNQLKVLEYASILHDIGKVGIPSVILNKPTALTEEEYGLIKKHPEFGAKILSTVPYLKETSNVILHHHEWFNGSGYPQGLKGDEINLIAQIICVTDAYDAMTSIRSYRPEPLSIELAKEQLILGRGTQFNPQFVDLFIKIV